MRHNRKNSFDNSNFSLKKLAVRMARFGLAGSLMGILGGWKFALTSALITALLGGIAYCDCIDD